MMGTPEYLDETTSSELFQEIHYVVPDMETTCGICLAEFLDAEDLQVHLTQVHNDESSTGSPCQFCDFIYTNLEEYATHIRDTHLLKLTCCQICAKVFIDSKNLRRHERKHNVAGNCGLFSCSQCPALFSSVKELQCHDKTYHNNSSDGEIIKCMPHLSACLNLNAAIILKMEVKVFQCNKCQLSSPDLSKYIQHLNNKKCVSFVCDICSNVYKTKKNLQKHYKSKNICIDLHCNSNDSTTCPVCKKVFLAMEMGSHVKNCQVFNCCTCDITFGSIEELSKHQTDKHPSELNLTKCRFCLKEYVGAKALKKHMDRAHKPSYHLYKYMCKECEAIFKHPQNLFAHYFTHHRELEPYTCKICDKKFRIRKRFTLHIKLEHQGKGFVEFNEQYHVLFSAIKSDKPFVPECVIPHLLSDNEEVVENIVSETDYDTNAMKEKINKSIGNNDKSNKAMQQKRKVPVKRKKRAAMEKSIAISSEDEEESLHILKKREERKQFQKRVRIPFSSKILKRRNRLTCEICLKYCYTFQNYENHMKIHSKKKDLSCIKCSKTFVSKHALSDHMVKDHATSKLIETLKNVIERKQVVNSQSNDTEYVDTADNTTEVVDHPVDLSPPTVQSRPTTMRERFLKTIKKVKVDNSNVVAKLKSTPDNLSVKKFIESFKPDKDVVINQMVTIKQYNSPFIRLPTITMTKFTPDRPFETVKLKMPERFKAQQEEEVKVSIKLVHEPLKPAIIEKTFQSDNHQDHDYDNAYNYDTDDDKSETIIPDVAQEIMLEGSEEIPKQNVQPHKIVIPNLPKGYPKVHIATLQPEAPYFKIIEVETKTEEPIVIDIEPKKAEEAHPKEELIKLPDGSRFIPANPLAHLIGDKKLEDVLKPIRTSYYKASKKNFKGLLEAALNNMDKPTPRKKTSKKQPS